MKPQEDWKNQIWWHSISNLDKLVSIYFKLVFHHSITKQIQILTDFIIVCQTSTKLTSWNFSIIGICWGFSPWTPSPHHLIRSGALGQNTSCAPFWLKKSVLWQSAPFTFCGPIFCLASTLIHITHSIGDNLKNLWWEEFINWLPLIILLRDALMPPFLFCSPIGSCWKDFWLRFCCQNVFARNRVID